MTVAKRTPAVATPTASTHHAFALHIEIGARTISVRGSLDVVSADRLVEAAGLLLRQMPGSISLNLVALDFIDAAGLGALVTIERELAARDDELLISWVTPLIRRVFVLAHLDSLLTSSV